MIDLSIRKMCAMHNVPFSKEDVDYSHIYSFNVAKVPVLEIFTEYFNNRGGRTASLVNHINKIKSNIIKDGGLQNFPPIFVDINTNQILDGNCRFKALQNIIEDGSIDPEKLTLRVIYEDVPENEFNKRIMELNTSQKSWSLIDVVYSYANVEYPSFVKLVQFCLDNETMHDGGKINPRYAAAVLGIPSTRLKDDGLIITDEDIKRGTEITTEAKRLRLVICKDLDGGGGWYEPFLQAWAGFRQTLGDIPFDDYLKEVKQTVERRRSKVRIPYASNKKVEWNDFFLTNKMYAYEARQKIVA